MVDVIMIGGASYFFRDSCRMGGPARGCVPSA